MRTLIVFLLGWSVVHGGPAFARVERGFSGAEVYAQNCAMCHSKGTGGAPRPHEFEQWRDRLASGRANLLRAVLRGKGEMPPKGGNASLSVREAHDALDFMLPGRIGAPRGLCLE